MGMKRSVKHFRAWAHQLIQERASALNLEYVPDEDIVTEEWMGYFIVYLKFVTVHLEDAEGDHILGRMPINFVGNRPIETSVEGEGDDTEFSVEVYEPMISATYPELVFVLTPEGKRVYRSMGEEEEE